MTLTNVRAGMLERFRVAVVAKLTPSQQIKISERAIRIYFIPGIECPS